MFDGTDLLFNTDRVSSLKRFLQILQNEKFTYMAMAMQNSYCDHRNFVSGNQTCSMVDLLLQKINFITLPTTQPEYKIQNYQLNSIKKYFNLT